MIERIARERRQKGQEKAEAVRLMEEEEAQHIMKNEVLRPLVMGTTSEQAGAGARDPQKGGGDMDELFALAKKRREKQEEKVRSPPEGETKPSPKAILLKSLENYFRKSEL